MQRIWGRMCRTAPFNLVFLSFAHVAEYYWQNTPHLSQNALHAMYNLLYPILSFIPLVQFRLSRPPGNPNRNGIWDLCSMAAFNRYFFHHYSRFNQLKILSVKHLFHMPIGLFMRYSTLMQCMNSDAWHLLMLKTINRPCLPFCKGYQMELSFTLALACWAGGGNMTLCNTCWTFWKEYIVIYL